MWNFKEATAILKEVNVLLKAEREEKAAAEAKAKNIKTSPKR